MGTHTEISPADTALTENALADDVLVDDDVLIEDAAVSEHDRRSRSTVVRARHQRFGLALLGALCCLAALVFTQWDAQQNPGRWFWVVAGPLAGALCLVRAQADHGGHGADRDASPYYGIFAGVVSGSLLLMLLAVDGWILPSVFFAMAVVLAFMAWIEQSAIGMTSALAVAVLCAGSGMAALDETSSVELATLSIGVMLLVAALALGRPEPAHEPA